ncbi:MAG: 4Fe-4S dicluster domain-containing protein [Acidobacteriota bacterium]
MEIKRTIKYESELDRNFVKEVAGMPGGEAVYSCIQCGTCSGICPVSHYMDFTPRKIVSMIRGGFRNEVLNSFTIWLCASCYACTVNCPMDIKITDIMYSLKMLAMKEGRYPAKFPMPILAEEFTKMVKKYGRVNESRLVSKLFMKTSPLKAMKYSKLGWTLFRKGRMELFPSSVDQPKSIAKALESLEG